MSAQDANRTNDSTETKAGTGTINATDIDPRYENVTVPITDARPFEFGTTVFVREETVLSMTFAADAAEIAGNVSVSGSTSPALEELAASRTVHQAVDITVPENATETAATMQLVVRALPVEDRENLEVMRYDGATETWQPLDTEVISERTWSSDRGASVLLVETKTPGFSTFAVTETESANSSETDLDSATPNETDDQTNSEAGLNPHPDATTVWINDRRPYEYGTYVLINEETVRAITFAADKDQIRGIVAVNNSTSSAVDELRDERSVFRAVNITATENASRTPATLHLMVRALPVTDRDRIEVMRYDESAESWEALQTKTVSKRMWSEDHQASVFRIEAETPGFSTFAVTEAPEPAPSTSTEPDPEPADESASTETETEDSGLLFGFGLFEIAIVALVVAGGGGAVFVVRRR